MTLNTKQKQIENRIELWSMIGPLIMVLTLLVVLINPVYHQLSLPFIAFFGLILCWKWRIPGLILSLTILGAFTIYQLIQIPDKMAWITALSSAIGLTFCITALSFKELAAIFTQMTDEEILYQHSIKSTEEKLISTEKKANDAEKAFKNNIEILQDQLAEKIASLKSYDTLTTMAREEVLHANKQNENLSQELSKLRNQCELLRQDYEEISILRQEEQLALKNQIEKETVQQKIIHDLKANLANYDKEILSLRSLDQQKNLQIEENVHTIRNLQSQIAIHEQEIIQHRQKSEALLSACEKKETAMAEQIIASEKKCLQAEEKILQLEQELATAQSPITVVDDREIRKIDGMYFQLKEQFDEKHQILEDTRRQLFLTQEELARCRKELDSIHLYGAGEETQIKLDSHVLKTANELATIKNNYEAELEGLQDLVSHFINKDPSIEVRGPIVNKDPVIETKDPVSDTSKAKKKPQKKTTDWANTILSRWSEPHDHSQ